MDEPKNINDVSSPILVALLTSGEHLDLHRFFSRIKAEMFKSSSRREIFKLIKKSFDENGTVDMNFINFPEELYTDVVALAGASPVLANFDSYCDLLVESHKKNRLLQILTDLDKFQYESSENIAIDKIGQLESLIKSYSEERELLTRGDALAEKAVETIESKAVPFDLSTGFQKLDDMIFLAPEDLWVIGARPSMGKTAFLLALAKNYAKQGKKIGFFSLEMNKEILMMRMLSSVVGLNFRKLLIPKEREDLSEIHMDHLRRSSKQEFLKNIYFFDEPGTDIDTLKFQVKEMVRLYGIEILCIDYLQYINNDKEFYRPDLKIADTMKELKKLCRNLKLLGILLAQLNRKSDDRGDKHPLMTDLDGSSEIEKSADVISFLYREAYYAPNSGNRDSLEITIAKQRNGPTGNVKMRFQGEYQRVLD